MKALVPPRSGFDAPAPAIDGRWPRRSLVIYPDKLCPRGTTIDNRSPTPRHQFLCAAGLILAASLCFAAEADAGALAVLVGPPAMGDGGNNALMFSGAPSQYEVAYITSGGFESSLSLFPGLLFGQRFGAKNCYVGLGGGLVSSANGGGIGPYASFGYQSGSGSGFHFNADFKQAVGMNGRNKFFAAEALRVGTLFDF